MVRSILVIGGGAAGMMAAVFASSSGARVTVLERNEKAGKKLYITGKGRCNVTNDCTNDEFLTQVARNPRFLYSALDHFSPRDMMDLLEKAGCPVTVQRGRRVFPASEKASDVTRALTRLMELGGVRSVLNTRVTEILTEEGHATGAKTEDGRIWPADAVILATGGCSYPATGSTGDGWRLAGSLGHTLTPPKAVLCGLNTAEKWPAQLQGLSLKNITLTLLSGKKKLYEEMGEMLFTHFGISGPLVLEASCHLPDDPTAAEIVIDLKPGLTPEQLDARLQRELENGSRKMLHSVLPCLLPGSLAGVFAAICDINGEKLCCQVTRAEREALLRNLKAMRLHVTGPRPIEEAIVTRGGVQVKEVRPGTMESKLISGLYLAGEILDVDAHTGGYNLQIAFATGALAGESAAQG